MSVCECGHNLGQHPPDPDRPFAWPCRACECNEYREVKVEDLDPHRTVTYLENGVPHCYMGHTECYDGHEAERRADEADWLQDREMGL